MVDGLNCWQSLQAVRKEAGKAYAAVQNSADDFLADKEFVADLNHIMESADYPIAAEPIVATIKKFRLTPKDAIAHLKRLGSESRALFKAYDQPVKLGSARVTKQTQEALEGLIERRLKGSLYEDFVAARVRTAKTHQIESALKEGTGDRKHCKSLTAA